MCGVWSEHWQADLPLLQPLKQGWAINFPKGPHEKLGRLQRAVGHVYGGRGRSLFARNIAVSPVTAVNKAAHHLTLKLAALIFNQLNHCLLKCKLYLNLHVYIFFFTEAPPKSSPPISTSEPFHHCNIPNKRTHTHTHKRNRMPDFFYLKHVQILENVVNICIINDLSYPPVTHPQIIRMHFFLLPDPRIIHSARGYNCHPHYCSDINSITGL